MSDDAALLLVLAVVAVIVLGGFWLASSRFRTLTRLRQQSEEPLVAPPELRPLPVVVVNPSKFIDHGMAAHEVVRRECLRLGWQDPLWLPTTVESPGREQAAFAVEAGADLVLACGGDGTVRRVAAGLMDTRVPLGLLPAGTGNLLARNLDLPMDDLRSATRIALTGDDRAMDVGTVRFDDAREEVFLVMAGMGFDAAMMNTPEHLKARVGPAAYLVSGARHLYGRSTRVRITVDREPVRRRKVRAVIVGNCGRLLGGMVLMPDAVIDDGRLDLATLAPRGMVGWANVGMSILTRHRRGHSMLERDVAQRIQALAEAPMPAEVDGDVVGWTTSLDASVAPGALRVRVPELLRQEPTLAGLMRDSMTAARNRASTRSTTAGSAPKGSVTTSADALPN